MCNTKQKHKTKVCYNARNALYSCVIMKIMEIIVFQCKFIMHETISFVFCVTKLHTSVKSIYERMYVI